jgi:UDP-N-acetylglucosamine acyltransferase
MSEDQFTEAGNPARPAVLIHPTAIVDPAATLGEGVVIGPWVSIEGPAQIGDRCVIEARASIIGNVRMGADNRIGHGAVIGGWPQDYSFDPATESGVEIGARNMIREYCTIHRGTAAGSVTRVGDGSMLMVGAHLGHNARVGNRAVIANNVLLGGYAEVDDAAFIGGGSVFHQFVRVGRGAMIQGGSKFSKDVPPFALGASLNTIFGLNVVGMRRAGFSAVERAEIKAAYKLLYTSGLNISQAVERARERPWGAAATHLFEFAASAKKRGLSGFNRRTRGGDASAAQSGEM